MYDLDMMGAVRRKESVTEVLKALCLDSVTVMRYVTI